MCVCAGEDRLEVVARDFRVTNSRQELLFAANRKEVVVGADILRVSGEIGPSFSFKYIFKLQLRMAKSLQPSSEARAYLCLRKNFWHS